MLLDEKLKQNFIVKIINIKLFLVLDLQIFKYSVKQ
jgi:hypothetical protein